MTFTQILSAAYDECNYPSSPATAIVTRFKRFANEGVRHTLSQPGLSRLADSDLPYTFTTTASTARYVLPEAVSVIRAVTERTNDQALTPMSLQEYRQIEPDPTSNSGTPMRYVPIGKVAVSTQPADTSTIYVKSSDAADTTQTVYLEGILSGNTFTTSVTLTGTVAAAFSSRQFDQITDFYLSATTQGFVTLLEDSGTGTTLATIFASQLRPRYYGLYLWPTPAAAITYYVDYRRELTDMTVDQDEPPLPTDFHPMLVAYIVMRECEKTKDADGQQAAAARYLNWTNRLLYQVNQLADEMPAMGRGRWVGRSHFGGYYPADYYVRS